MNFSRADLADIVYFLSVAKHRNFRRAAIELSVSTSAVSHALKGLEDRLGVRLFNRTSRSVTLTAIGEIFHSNVSPHIDAIDGAFEDLNKFRAAPTGRLRLNVLGDAATLLISPVLPAFMERYPEVELEISADNNMVDVIAEGFDGGIRYGGTVPADMIAQRLSADIRWVVVGSPNYLSRYGTPNHPEDLGSHKCFRGRSGYNKIVQWEFEQSGHEFAVQVAGNIIVNTTETLMPALLSGGGLAYVPALLAKPFVDEGKLAVVLTEWSPLGPPFYMYYSSRKQVPTGLRLLCELIRELKPAGF
ncbi:LysR family transcriptional regulator [Rhizobium sp. P38BS-XIX]|uniref:LysR family transcriptional regulator n=1 Tax=Rhizobium sp. P38BS-XIX TaxID=2726740 RepID=UPI001457943C|nr:LysR family transcriptional regulator [Rhizobium sp. P38BS-XIX]NLR99911.1 LysR family transcriptional regulator [Rhizobium sp. P38BS-XIX]